MFEVHRSNWREALGWTLFVGLLVLVWVTR